MTERYNPTEIYPKEKDIKGYVSLIQRVYPNDNVINRKLNSSELLSSVYLDSSKTNELVDGLENAISQILPNEQEAIRLYFGLDDGKERKLMDVAREISGNRDIGIKERERVRYLISRGIRKIRSPKISKPLENRLWGNSPYRLQKI